jgi:hypothetical protein
MTQRQASWPLLIATILAVLLAVAACDLSVLEPSAAPPSLTPVPSASANPSFVRPTPAPQATFLAYVVASGDTLSSIADTFSTSAQSLAYWNRATYPSLDPESSRYDPNTIQAGWTLVLIPFAEVDPENLPPPSETPSEGESPTPGP